jgi:hypothetical protein
LDAFQSLILVQNSEEIETMLAKISVLLLGASTLTAALPAGIEVRTVAALNQAAFQEAQQRDATATRAFSSVAIKVHRTTAMI